MSSAFSLLRVITAPCPTVVPPTIRYPAAIKGTWDNIFTASSNSISFELTTSRIKNVIGIAFLLKIASKMFSQRQHRSLSSRETVIAFGLCAVKRPTWPANVTPVYTVSPEIMQKTTVFICLIIWLNSQAGKTIKANSVFWLATHVGKTDPSWPDSWISCVSPVRTSSVNSLLTKLFPSRWLDVCLVPFLVFIDLYPVSAI